MEHRDENTEELVVYQTEADYGFDNRWKSGPLVDYSRIEDSHWDGRLLEMDHSNLLRIKIYGLSVHQISALLSKLSGSERLQELEIGGWPLLEASRSEYTFRALKLLSIDWIRVVDRDGKDAVKREMPPPSPTVKFKANRITTVYLGKWPVSSSCSISSLSIISLRSVRFFPSFISSFLTLCLTLRPEAGFDSVKYVLFSNILAIRHLEIDSDPNRKLPKFEHLETLVINCVQWVQLDITAKFAVGELGLLQQLHCNLARLDSTNYVPTGQDLERLHNVFRTIKRFRRAGEIPVFFHGVRINFDKKFTYFHLQERLMKAHYHNFVTNEIDLPACPSVVKFNFLDLHEVSQRGEFGDMRFNRMTNRVESRTISFAELYPNLQKIVLEEDEEHKTSQMDYFDFLAGCRALRELQLNAPGFPKPFYDRLSRLDSLRTLTGFYLIEPPDTPIRLDFDFLQNWSYLRHFCSNLSCKSVMIKLVQRMPLKSQFIFLFFSLSQEFHVTVQKRNDSQLEILLADETKGFEIRRTVDCQDAANYLNSQKPSYFSHWLDELPDV